MLTLGFDTSNYTTSAAVFDSETNTVVHKKKLLNVQSGSKGLRQSDCVFQHTVSLPSLLSELVDENDFVFDAVGASVSPRSVEGSYMPCFLVGKNAAICASKTARIPFYSTSHQHGHIAAAIFSSGQTRLFSESFIAFHLSGGTTEALLVRPDKTEIFDITLIAKSLDLKAGQLVDRTGVLLGLQFPCGAELDLLSQRNNTEFMIRPSLKGNDCSLSGAENKIVSLVDSSSPPEFVADYCIGYIIQTIDKMTEGLISEFGELPLLFAGGVSSNSKLRAFFKNKYNAFFASPEFSSDNAAGVAIITAMKNKNDNPYR